MQIGDRVRVKDSTGLFGGCEGYIIEDTDECWLDSHLVELYKGNDSITKEEIEEYYVYFKEEDLELI